MTYEPQIESLINRVKYLTPEQAKDLAAAWGTKQRSVWFDTLRILSEANRFDTFSSARNSAWSDAWVNVRNDVPRAARGASWGAVRDAVLALVARDLIRVSDFNILYGPWGKVMDR